MFDVLCSVSSSVMLAVGCCVISSVMRAELCSVNRIVYAPFCDLFAELYTHLIALSAALQKVVLCCLQQCFETYCAVGSRVIRTIFCIKILLIKYLLEIYKVFNSVIY